MTKKPGQVVAERLRECRKRLGWSIKDLAAECARLGAPQLTVASLTNIERNQATDSTARTRRARDVTVDELFVLAYALGVPPLLMVVPLGENEPLQITTTATVHPHIAWQSATGQGPLAVTGNYATRLKDSGHHLQVIYLFDDLRQASEDYFDAEVRVQIVENNGTVEQVNRARERLAETIPPFAEVVDKILRRGLEVPPYRPATVTMLRDSGLVANPDRLSEDS